MRVLRVNITLTGTHYGEYPDAHVVLSLIYTAISGRVNVETLGNLKVSCLLPREGERLYLPAPTTWIPKLKETQDSRAKRFAKGIKRGALFVSEEYVRDATEDVKDLLEAVESGICVVTYRQARNTLDRLTNYSDTYFESAWCAKKPEEERSIEEFAFLIASDNCSAIKEIQSPLEEALWFTPVGANKSHGAVIKHVEVDEHEAPISFGAGILLSLALPADKLPGHIPVVKKKWVIYKKNSGLKCKEFGLYSAGSVLKAGEYRGCDVPVGDKLLFVRPLFWEVSDEWKQPV